MSDPFHLERFVRAQDPVMDQVRAELRRGRKESHWMWFVFPQIQGLGSSLMAREYAIASRLEAEAYLAHPVLGPRLIECTEILKEANVRSIEDVFGHIDSLKFRSSMTLFSAVSPETSVFSELLRKHFGGVPDKLTLQRL